MSVNKTLTDVINPDRLYATEPWNQSNDIETLAFLKRIATVNPYKNNNAFVVYSRGTLPFNDKNYCQWIIIPTDSQLTNPNTKTLLTYALSSVPQTAKTQSLQPYNATGISKLRSEHHQIFFPGYARNFEEVTTSAFRHIAKTIVGQMQVAQSLNWTTSHCFLHLQKDLDSGQQRSCLVAELVFTK